MGNNNLRVVPKMPCPNIIEFYLVNRANETRKIGILEMPCDNQLNDNLELAEAVCTAMRKRIRKSV